MMKTLNNFPKMHSIIFHGCLVFAALLGNPARLMAATQPTSQVSPPAVASLAFQSTSASAVLTVSGGGTIRLVVVREAATAAVAPTDGVIYSPNLTYAVPAGANSTTGPGNYVVKADAATQNFTVTGLPLGVAYAVDAYAYNQDNAAPVTNYLTAGPGRVGFTTQPDTYTFTGAAPSNKNTWNEKTNWAPERLDLAASSQIIIFDGAITPAASLTANFGQGSSAITESIGQLKLVRNAQATIFGPSNGNQASLLMLAGAPGMAGSALDVPAGSQLIFASNASTANRYFVVKTTGGQTGTVAGNVTFTTNSNDVPHRLLSTDAGSIHFVNGATFTQQIANGNPFGTTGANTLTSGVSDVVPAGSVVFEAGATYQQMRGPDPFGPNPVVSVFNKNSTYVFSGATLSSVGQTYGNLQLLASATVSGTQSMVIANNLTVGNGTLTGITANLNPTSIGPAGVQIGGDVTVYAGNQLSFTPVADSKVALNGTIGQTLSGVGPTFGASATLEINNSSDSGVTLNTPVTVVKGLALTLGLVNTTSTNLLTLPSAATISGGSSSDALGVGGSFVKGPVARTTSGAVSNLFFPVGKVSASTTAAPTGVRNYRPMSLTTTNQTSATTYTGEQMETSAGGKNGVAAPLDHVSYIRYFTLTPSISGVLTQPTGTGFSAAVTLSFGADDYVTDPSLATFVIAKRNSPALWASIGRGTNSATTLTSGGFSSFSDFSLASTAPTGSPSVNPLPVQLTRFTASARATGVALDWATASEKNNERFEVERSADGTSFKAVGTVKGQGNSTSAHEYAFGDAKPLAGQSYYRLRQVNFDGTATFSPVATVNVERGTELAYPSPSNGTITLAANLGAVDYRIINNLGQTLLRGHAAGSEQLNLMALPKGVYLLEIVGHAGRTTQRLLRE